MLASFTAISLFMSQIYIYLQVDTRHSFILSKSHPLSLVVPTEGGYSNILSSPHQNSDHRTNQKPDKKSQQQKHDVDFLESNRMTISVHLTFPHIYCNDLDYSHDGSSLSNGKINHFYGRNLFTRRLPTDYEDYRATTGCTESQAAGKSRRVGVRTDGYQEANKGCTIEGMITVPRIGGDLTFTMVNKQWLLLAKKMEVMLPSMQMSGPEFGSTGWDGIAGSYNMTYFIHDITFYDGRSSIKPRASSSTIGSTNQLREAVGRMNEGENLAHTSLAVTLIPTRVKRFARRAEDIYQASVSKTLIGPLNMVMSQMPISPGLSIQYDFSPLAVHHVESRENVFVFLSSLVGIVGGVFVTVGLVSGCLVSSAAAVSKKMD